MTKENALKLWQVIILSGDDHYSIFVAAQSREETHKIAAAKIKAADVIHASRKVSIAAGKDKDYRIILK